MCPQGYRKTVARPVSFESIHRAVDEPEPNPRSGDYFSGCSAVGVVLWIGQWQIPMMKEQRRH